MVIKLEKSKTFLIRSPQRPLLHQHVHGQHTPGTPFWMQVVDEVVDSMKNDKFGWMVDKHLIVLNTTNPGMLDDVVQKTKENVVLLPSAYVYPKECVLNSKRPWSKHLTGSFWVSPSAQMMSHIYASPHFAKFCVPLGIVSIALFVLLVG